jgi:hypothetical protein
MTLATVENIELFSLWLLRNGSNVQHLHLRFKSNPLPLLSTLPTSTPQLKGLRVAGLVHLHGHRPGEAVAAWGALSSLTSLEVDTLTHMVSAVKQLPNLVELSVATSLSVNHSLVMLVAALPRLQVLRLPALDIFCPSYIVTKQELDGLRSLQQLQRVDNVCVEPADLTHPFVISKCYPSMHIMMRRADDSLGIADWVDRGGGKQLPELVLCAIYSRTKPVVTHWSGFTALRSLELIDVDLNTGLQQLRGLTQLTHLKMDRCSPDIGSLGQLPPGLISLSLDNLRLDAVLHEQQQQQQQQGSSVSTSQLPHLTSLVLKNAVASGERVITGLTNLQQLVLERNAFIPSSWFDSFSQLTCLSSLTIPSLGPSNLVLEKISLLAKSPSLQQLEVTRQFLPPLQGLEIGATLGHLTAIKLCIDRPRDLWDGIVSGDLLQVRGFKAQHWRLGKVELGLFVRMLFADPNIQGMGHVVHCAMDLRGVTSIAIMSMACGAQTVPDN